MDHPKHISIQDYTYELPDEKIALRPLAERDASKLLVYHNHEISERIYKNIAEYLPRKSLLVFNDTRVIRARIRFQKPTGGVIEIFCLEPFESNNEYSSVMDKKGRVRWKCMIGGASKWKGGGLEKQLVVNEGEPATGNRQWVLSARLVNKLPDAYVVEFSWQPAELTFAEVLEQAGDIPLPPYIKRDTEINDTERYQTIYARDEGSVAAPTAGLHFTKDIFDQLKQKDIMTGFITLHVGAGTFKPVKAAVMEDHVMHSEWIDVDASMIEQLIDQIGQPVIAVGTTATRTLESLYWMGVKASLDPSVNSLMLSQWEAYEEPLQANLLPAREALSALLHWMKRNGPGRLFTSTGILIAPGYVFRIVNAIITNFHQPQSTLLLLVAAAVGDDWKKIYDHALQNAFRFLSYGDGCLLFIQ
jgi:S-adenosylmethionine:tRNA ribosyltransferase-isomerase